MPARSSLPHRRTSPVALLALALCVAFSLLGVAPDRAAAADDPKQVNFTLEGCRLAAGGTLPNASGDFVCADAEYTTGNLGKHWNELDLVPFRLTAETGTAQTYAVVIAADHKDGGHRGYDTISVPELNAGKSSGTCALNADPTDVEVPGVGGVDETMYRVLTITQSAGAHCVWDYHQRLALGSHQFPGASLHANLLNQAFGSAGVGSRDVSIPVKEIAPQGLGKTMTASTGQGFVWNVTKDSSPAGLTFETCGAGPAAQQQGVTIKVAWKRTALVNGQVTVVTNITLTNPAHRAITAHVTDEIFEGSDQTVAFGTTYDSGPVEVPANSTLTLTNTQTDTSAATSFNDVAHATYVDTVTGVPVPGQTTAVADATLEVVNAANAEADISDTEQISGAGLSFSIDSVEPAADAAGLPASYVLGNETTGPITWTKHVTGDGEVTFNKTVHVDGAITTAGVLSDVATVEDGLTAGAQASAQTTITARACIAGTKYEDLDGDGVRDPNEPGLGGVTVYVDLNDNGAFDAGEPSAVTAADGSYSISAAGIPDGPHPVREVVPTGQVCSSPAPCVHSVVVGAGAAVQGVDFGNYKPAGLKGLKFGDLDADGQQDAGEPVLGGFTFYVDLDGDGQHDAGEPSAISAADGTWTIKDLAPGAYTVREAAKPGYQCTAPDPCRYEVTLESGDRRGGLTFGNAAVDPKIAIAKSGPASAVAGASITYAIEVSNPGPVSFAEDTLAVKDALCEAPPALTSKHGDATPGSLDPGETWSYSCKVQSQVGQTAVQNVATVSGIAASGKTATASATADTTLTQPIATVTGAGVPVTQGTAKLRGPSRCVQRAMTAVVTGTKIKRVRFYLNGRLVKTLIGTGAPRYAYRVGVTRRPKGSAMRLVARVEFLASARTRTKTLGFTFRRCGQRAVAPKFTG